MAAVNYLNSVPKLIGRENYDEWSFAVENVFVLEGLTKCINGTEEDSVLVAKAKAKFVLTLDPSLYVHVKDAKTCREAWDKIKNLYEDVGFTKKIGLLRNLISLRLNNCENMESYVNQVIETAQKLRKTNFDISEEWIGSLLLAGLPEKFSPMLMAIEHAGIAITTDSIKSKLLDMEIDGANGSAGAFATSPGADASGWKKKKNPGGVGGGRHKSNVRNDEGRNKDKTRIICFKCKQPGHFMSKCPTSLKNEEKYAFSASFLKGNFSKEEFYLDSGASRHMCTEESRLFNKTTSNIAQVTVANHQKLKVKCLGDMDIVCSVNGVDNKITVHDMLCVPSLTTNLLSVSELISKGNRVSFEKDGCSVYTRNNKLVATASLVSGVYKLNIKTEKCMLMSCDNTELWHRRLAHINSQDLNKMRHCVDGLELKGVASIDKSNCVVCCEGKQARLPFPNTGTRSNQLLEVIHGDVCGPMDTISIGGSKYFLLLVDDFSRMSFVYFLRAKSDVFDCFRQFKAMVEKQQGRSIKKFRSDQGGEFCGAKFKSFLEAGGIIHQMTNAYTPEQNGLSERHNRTLVEKARCLLFDASLHKRFWAEAVNTANYLRNRCVASGLNGKTPFELWNGKKPDISNVRVFGSTVMAHIPKEKRHKFDRKATKHILVGFSENVKGYRIYNPNTDDVTTSRDVIIHETLKTNKMNDGPGDLLSSRVTNGGPDQVGESLQDPQVLRHGETLEGSFESCPSRLTPFEHFPIREDSTDGDYKPSTSSSIQGDPGSVRRSQRPRQEKQFNDYVTYFSTSEDKFFLKEVPTTVAEALSSRDCDQWKHAMQHEYDCLVNNHTWEMVDAPEKSAVQCKWVFKIKLDQENKKTFRARLVAKGFTQREGVDFYETFSPVVRHSTLRVLIALSVNVGLNIFHLDVTTAFLHGELEEIVYMKQPEEIGRAHV